MTRFLFWLLALGLLGACARPTIYSWGRYQDVVYSTYSQPSEAGWAQQIEILESDLANTDGKPTPPGFHAHLGHLYFQAGQLDKAREEFEKEKSKFPESSVFMNRLLRAIDP